MVEKNGHRYVVRNDSNIFLTCEHASKNIPTEYKNLGLSQSELENAKDLYDPGSREMTEYLSKNLNSSALYSDVSRLVIDCNRKINAATKNKNTFHSCPLKTELIVENNGEECMVSIPENVFEDKGIFDQEEKIRYERYVVPYVNSVYDVLDKLRKKHKKTYIVQMHSFFPVYNGSERSVDIAVLYDEAEESANRIIESLRGKTDLVVAGNDPWSMKDTDGAVFEKVYDMDDVELIAFDVNNKHLKTREGIQSVSNLIFETLRSELVVR